MKNYMGKTIYITGGSSGIGLAVAGLFASKGASIIIFARDKGKLEKALAGIKKMRLDKSQRFGYMSLDVSDNKRVSAAMQKAVKEFGVPDVLINCAGRAYPRRFEDITYEQFDETMKINLYGVWNVVSCLAEHMKARGGYIVNTSSMAGFVGVFGYADYSASKFAIVGFSEVLKSEMKQFNIDVSVLCPPDTDTPGFHVENQTKPEETKAVSSSAKIMSPNQVALTLLKGMEKKRFMIIPGFDGNLTYIVKRLFPWLVQWIMHINISKVLKTQ